MNRLIIFIFLLSPSYLWAQQETSQEAAREYIEEIISNLEDDDLDNVEFVVQLLDDLLKKPIDLNRNDLSSLSDAGLITNEQRNALELHKFKFGRLLALYELQTIPEWDLATIRRVAPFIQVKRDLDQVNLNLKDLAKASGVSIRSYLSRRFPKSDGFISENDESPAFEGDPYRHYLRVRARYAYRFSVGFTVEKDAGEALFSKSNTSYDYTSFHAYAQNITQTIGLVALGDYKVNMGQGLILHNGFGGNKSSFVTQVKKGGKFFRPHGSTSEVNFFRGGGVELNIASNWRVAVFYSSIKRDANIVTDTIDGEVAIQEFTSLQTSGLHRTASEIEDEKQIPYQAIGGRVGIQKNKFSFHVNVLHNSFDNPLSRTIRTYNQFQFNGDELFNTSIDYSYSLGQLHLFGESAYSDNGATAHLIGLKAGLSKKVKWIGIYRNYARDYLTIRPNSFGESRNANNEIGFYNGLEYAISRKYVISGYIDLWSNRWLRFNVDAPARGKEYLLKFRFNKRRKLEAYVLYKFEEKAVSGETQSFSDIDLRKRNQIRCHLNYKINTSLEWRTRVEYNHVKFADRTSDGFLIYQDLIYRPKLSKFSFTSRYSFFQTDDFDSRIFAYENHLLFNYSLPGFFDTGHRFYINLRYRPTRPLTLELRFDQISFTDRSSVGSGINERIGNTVRQLAVQVSWRIE